MMKIIALSDTHSLHNEVVLPKCDVLIHAGDFSGNGSMSHVNNFLDWFSNQDATVKLATPGNHDTWVEKNTQEAISMFKNRGVELLIHAPYKYNTIKFFLSPYTPEFMEWSFMYPRMDGKKVWEDIPEDTNILVTHGPPHQILDYVPRSFSHQGCTYLRQKISEIKPAYHIFGHIHEGYGYKLFDSTHCYNVSVCNKNYDAINKPIELEI
jgi:Icc-related predicted phosphoesterase